MTAPFDPAYGDVVEAPATVSPDFTVAEFLAWVRTKPADEEYDYGAPHDCAICQFLKATARTAPNAVIGMVYWVDVNGDARRIPFSVDKAADNGGQDWTFGALAKRLETIAYRGRVG
jgi:hypothetical protein